MIYQNSNEKPLAKSVLASKTRVVRKRSTFRQLGCLNGLSKGEMFGLPYLLGAALNGFYWRVINILQSVIGPEPWDYVGTIITAHIPIKTD